MTVTCATCAGDGEVPWGGEVTPLLICPSCAGKGWKAPPAEQATPPAAAAPTEAGDQ